MMKMMRKQRTSTRVFSRPEFTKDNLLLIGIHKTRAGATKKISNIGDWRLSKSRITKTKRGYKSFVKFK